MNAIQKNAVFAEVNASGDKMEVHFRYDADLVRSIKEVPGARYCPPGDGGPMWTVPLSLDVARRLREEMGPGLVLGHALRVWGKEQVARERNLQVMASIDSVAAKDLKLHGKIPKLAEWFRGYQCADVQFMAATSCLNLNDPGLGKTTEVIGAVFEADLEDGAHLVVAQKTSLETVWRMEIERWTADLDRPHEVITYSAEMTGNQRFAVLTEFLACIEEKYPVWFICTDKTLLVGERKTENVALAEINDLLRKALFETEWNTFTIDEYHKTGLPSTSGKRGTGSKFGDAVRDIKSQRRYALSGTPMGGRPIKLWGGFHFLYPKQFTSKFQWAKTWLQVDSSGYGTDIGSIQKGREDEFYKSIAPYVVRRLKSEVLPQLPPKQFVDVWCDMTTKQKKQYDDMASKAELEIESMQLSAIGILAQYTRLKIFADAYCDNMTEKLVDCTPCGGEGNINGETCSRCLGTGKRLQQHPLPSNDSGKLPYLMERLAEAGIDPSDPTGDACAIVASQFKDVADMIHAYLNHKGIHAEKITGDTSAVQRAEIQRKFQEGGEGSPRVVVMTTTAGGVSITLDRADTVHIFDETWVPDDQQQFADRAHRASRMHQVTVFTYRSNDSIEKYIHETVTEKDIINKSILDIRRNGFRANMQALVAS